MQTVTVVFRADREYEFNVHADDLANISRSNAENWLNEEFDELECTPSNPVGKVLMLDVILNVAKYGGEPRFAKDNNWARMFASCVAVVLDRPSVRIDVPGFIVR